MENITRSISPSKAKSRIIHAINQQLPVFLWGPPGIGKSDIVSQIADDFNAFLCDVRLSLWEPTDIKGIPYFDSNQGKMVWAPPVELPDQELANQHDMIILFLDEMNSAPPAVQAAAYQLILNRRVGNYYLPDNVAIIAAGNRETDNGVTYRMPKPLANRFLHLDLQVDFLDWKAWATTNRIHNDVIGYLEFSKKDLYDFDPRSADRAFATPRSWTFVSKLLQNNTDDEAMDDLIAGAIGLGLSTKFMAHRAVAATLPNPEDVLNGKVKKIDTKEVSAMYSLTVAMCYELKESADKNDKKFNSKINNFLRFSMDNFETELVVMGIKLALTQYALPIDPDEVECFDEFHERYGKYIRAAQEN